MTWDRIGIGTAILATMVGLSLIPDKDWSYLGYVIRHKRAVYTAGRLLKVGRWRLLMHDLSKLRPDEWGPYTEWFYGNYGTSWKSVYVAGDHVAHIDRAKAQTRQRSFMTAFLLHLHRNPHHWQHWVLTPDAKDRPMQVFEMPKVLAREMVADWMGAGMAINGHGIEAAPAECRAWYERLGPKDRLHPTTRAYVEGLLAGL